MNILFRVDSSFFIGAGHVMRDLVLASQLKKENPKALIKFSTQDLDGNINDKITESKFDVITLHSNTKIELLELINSWNVDLLVIDHYEIDYAFETFLKENSKAKILSFDDTYEAHNCDILLNHNIYADKKRYKNRMPETCELRCGAKYTLLRDEFYKEKSYPKCKLKTKNKSVFLAMGGVDHSNLNIKILEVIKEFSDLRVNLVTTTANKNLQELQEYIKDKNWIELHVNSNNIAKLMHESDFAIITPSVTANEAYFMRLPFIAIKTADNQKVMLEYLKQEQYPVLEKFDKKELYDWLENVI